MISSWIETFGYACRKKNPNSGEICCTACKTAVLTQRTPAGQILPPGCPCATAASRQTRPSARLRRRSAHTAQKGPVPASRAPSPPARCRPAALRAFARTGPRPRNSPAVAGSDGILSLRLFCTRSLSSRMAGSTLKRRRFMARSPSSRLVSQGGGRAGVRHGIVPRAVFNPGASRSARGPSH